MSNQLELVQSYLNSEGYNFLVDLTRDTNRWHSVNEGDTKGAYIFDRQELKDKTEVIIFTFYDYRKSESFTKEVVGRSLTKAESKYIEEKIEAQREASRKEQERRWNDCREQCLVSWNKAIEPSGRTLVLSHPYIQKKFGEFSNSLGTCLQNREHLPELSSPRYRENTMGVKELLIPIQDSEGVFWGYQIIREDGSKEFLEGQRTGGMFHLIPGESNGRIYFCEGYATGLTVFAAFKGQHSVVVCFNAGNLRTASLALRTRYPKVPFIFCADNDKWKPALGNAGVNNATRAAEESEGTIVIPVFSSESTKPTDFNDLLTIDGIHEVERQLRAADIRRPQFIYCLGYNKNAYYLSTTRNPQIQAMTDFSTTDLFKLATKEYWERNYPGARGGMDIDKIKSDLIDKGQAKGIFEPTRIRGKGVHIDNGNVIIHVGNKILTDEGECDLQDYKSNFYFEPRMSFNLPSRELLSPEEVATAERLLNDLAFEKQSDGKIFMGWIMLAHLAGSLEWRPNLMITAASGTGKSSVINYIINPLFEHTLGVRVESATEASVRQTLGPDSSIVILDEFDTNAGDPRRLGGLINLARIASSGGTVSKGTVSGKALQYNARFITLFSGVNPPLLTEADRSRITELVLTSKYKRENWDEFRNEMENFWPHMGHKILWTGATRVKNLIQSARILHSIIGGTFGPRAGQQYGSLLAGYWHWKNEKVIGMDEATALVALFQKENNEQNLRGHSDTDECFEHLMDMPMVIGEEGEKTPLSSILNMEQMTSRDRILESFGLVVTPDGWLFVPNKHPELTRYFKDTLWPNWTKTLRRLPDVATSQVCKAHYRARGVKIKLAKTLSVIDVNKPKEF